MHNFGRFGSKILTRSKVTKGLEKEKRRELDNGKRDQVHEMESRKRKSQRWKRKSQRWMKWGQPIYHSQQNIDHSH